MFYAKTGSTEQAAEKLLLLNPTAIDLAEIVRFSKTKAPEAWERLKPPHDEWALDIVVSFAPSPYREYAADQILAKPMLECFALISVMKKFPDKIEECWQKLSEMDVKSNSLFAIAQKWPALAERAMAKVTPPVKDCEYFFSQMHRLEQAIQSGQ